MADAASQVPNPNSQRHRNARNSERKRILTPDETADMLNVIEEVV